MVVKIIRGIYLLFNILVIITLLAIHFVLKENSFGSSLLFYIFPLPVIICIVIALSVFLGKWGRYNFALAAVLLVFWFFRSYKLSIPERVNQTDVELVFWNASRNNGFSEAFKLNGGLPDIMVLTETSSFDLKALKEKYPKYYFYKSATELVVFSKTPIRVIKEYTSKYRTYMLFFKSAGLNLCAVDVQGSTDVPRSWELGFVNAHIKNKPNTVVLGDFNVPFESKYLNRLKQNFNHTFSVKGNGFRETWFWNLPLLSLDHIWASKDLKILKAEKRYTFRSDHNMIKVFIDK